MTFERREPQDNVPADKPAFKFGGADYFHRYSKDGLHEFTPKAQPDLKKWTDMVTVNEYSSVKDGEGLAATANAVLANYENNGAVVMRSMSVPRTPKKPAEHLIVAMFARPEFSELAYAKFVLYKGKGASIVYSHRVYGEKAGDGMSAWLLKYGASREKELMAMTSVPKNR